MTVEYDLPVLLDGNVASIEAKLPELSIAHLTALDELERGGKTRVTLLGAIKAELDGREQVEALAAAAPLAPLPQGTVPQDEPAAVLADGFANSLETPPAQTAGPDDGDSEDGTFPDAPLPEPTSGYRYINDPEIDFANTLDLTTLGEALVEAGFELGAGDNIALAAVGAIRGLTERVAELSVRNEIPNELVPPEGALATLELSADADADTAVIVMFEGTSGRPIPSLGKLTFDAGDFVQDVGGKSRTLARPIVFPTAIEVTEVCGVWLLDEDGEPWSRCPVVGRLSVGGGRQAAIPAHYLRFDAPATVKAAA